MIKRYALLIFSVIIFPLLISQAYLYANFNRSVRELLSSTIQQNIAISAQQLSDELDSDVQGMKLFSSSKFAATALFFNESIGLSEIMREHLTIQKKLSSVFVVQKSGDVFAQAFHGTSQPELSDQAYFRSLLTGKTVASLRPQQVAIQFLPAGALAPGKSSVVDFGLLFVMKVFGDNEDLLGYLIAYKDSAQLRPILNSLTSSFNAKGVQASALLHFNHALSGRFTLDSGPDLDGKVERPLAVAGPSPLVQNCKTVGLGQFSLPLSAELCLSLDGSKMLDTVLPNLRTLLYFLFSAAVISIIFGVALASHISKPIGYLVRQIEQYKSGLKPNVRRHNFKEKEFKLLIDSFDELVKFVEIAKVRDLEIAKMDVLYRLSSEVAHDIRSPIAALQAIIPNIEAKLEDDERIMLKSVLNRITGIADTLTERRKSTHMPGALTPVTCLIALEVHRLVLEKQFEFAAHAGLKITFSASPEARSSTVTLDPIGLRRALSNLINNAVEAVSYQGQVNAILEMDNGSVLIHLKDNGIGMTQDILAQLGQEGFSAGKQTSKGSGMGIGFSAAKRVVEEVGGTVQVRSTPRVGSTITLRLTAGHRPNWLKDSLKLHAGSDLFVLDDDVNVHEAWRQKLRLNLDSSVNLRCFLEPTDFVNSLPPDRSKFVAVVDYRLSADTSVNGIRIIEQTGLKSHAILVTNDYADAAVQATCNEVGLMMMPKPLLYMADTVSTLEA
jgi:signal transduction histidine kinase